MISPLLMALVALAVVGIIASCALMGKLDEPAAGDYDRSER